MFFSASNNSVSMKNDFDHFIAHSMAWTLEEKVEIWLLHVVIKEVYEKFFEQSREVHFGYALNETQKAWEVPWTRHATTNSQWMQPAVRCSFEHHSARPILTFFLHDN